jgi:hypothetical protein
MKDAHVGLMTGTAAIFGLNTVTGVRNLWEARKDPNHRGKRMTHVRFQGKVFAFNLSCPHENAAVRGKAAVNRFAVKRSSGNLVVDISRLIKSDTEKAQWEAAVIAA